MIVEPAAGDGSVVLAIVQRMIDSCRTFNRPIASTSGSLLAYELDPDSAAKCRTAVVGNLVASGSPTETALNLT